MKKLKTIFKYIKETWKQFSADQGFMMAGALAYYTLFSIAPLLVIVLAIISFLTQSPSMEAELFNQLGEIMGNQRSDELRNIVANVNSSSSGSLATFISSMALLFSATAVVIHLKDTLNKAWNVTKNPAIGFKAVILDRILSLGFLVGIGFVFLVSLGLNAVAILLSEKIANLIPSVGELTIFVVSFSVGSLISFILFFLVFKYLPDTKLYIRDLVIGALATTVLFSIGKYVLAYYLGVSNIGTTFGSAGALASFMIWVYYNAVIIIVGAEFTQVYALENGRSIRPNDKAVKVEKIIKDIS